MKHLNAAASGIRKVNDWACGHLTSTTTTVWRMMTGGISIETRIFTPAPASDSALHLCTRIASDIAMSLDRLQKRMAKLPQELWNQIYDLVIEPPQDTHILITKHWRWPSILALNRAISTDLRRIWYLRNNFHFDNYSTWEKWMNVFDKGIPGFREPLSDFRGRYVFCVHMCDTIGQANCTCRTPSVCRELFRDCYKHTQSSPHTVSRYTAGHRFLSLLRTSKSSTGIHF